MARATAVFQEITKLIGKSGEDTSKLLIMNTTLSFEKNPLFVTVAGSLDLVLRQYYGSQKSNGDDFGNLNKDWEGYRKYIEPRQFLIDFSFYEENDRSNRWGDINNYDPSHPESAQSIEGTRAKKYATWQPNIRLINAQEIGGLDRSENIVKEAIFLVPKDASVTDISNLKEEDWVQVAEVKDGKVIEGQAVNTVDRFCKFLIKETQGHGVPYLSEFQVLGWEVDDIKYTEATKMVATARSEAKKAGFTVAVATFDQA